MSGLENAWGDLKYALRSSLRHRTFSIGVVATLAIGIGAACAIFALIDAAVLRPLPSGEGDRLVRLETRYATSESQLAFPDSYRAWRDQTALFEAVSAHRLEFMNLTGGTGAELAPVARVTASFFRIFPVTPAAGSVFAAGEDRPGGSRVAVLSAAFWARRFGGAAHPGAGTPPASTTTWVAEPLKAAMVGGARSMLWLVSAAVGLVLLVACANVANLLLVRAEARKREVALRRTLGAGWGNMFRLSLIECAVLSFAGGVLGLVVGLVAVRGVLAVYPATNPFNAADGASTIAPILDGGDALRLDGHVVAFTAAVSAGRASRRPASGAACRSRRYGSFRS